MSKKTILISAIIIILVLAAGGFYTYKKNLIPFGKKPAVEILTPEKLLTFQIKDKNIQPEAIKIYQDRFDEVASSLKKNNDDFNSWLFLGIIKKGVGDFEGARDVWTYAAQIRPNSSTPLANLADLYANFLNQPAKGLDMIKKAIASDPNDYNFYLMMAEIYRYRVPGQEAMYETAILDAIQKFPDNPNLIGPLALYYRQTNQTKKAIEFYEKLVKLAPDNQAAKEDLAELRKK